MENLINFLKVLSALLGFIAVIGIGTMIIRVVDILTQKSPKRRKDDQD